MMAGQELFYNLVTRDALLIHGGVAHSLEGPFDSREDAERAAEVLVERLIKHDDQNGSRGLSNTTPATN